MSLEEQVPQRLRMLRHFRQWSLREAARRAGMSESVLGAYERGNKSGKAQSGRAVSLKVLSHLVDFYGVPVAFFFEPDDRLAHAMLFEGALAEVPPDGPDRAQQLIGLMEQLLKELRAETATNR